MYSMKSLFAILAIILVVAHAGANNGNNGNGNGNGNNGHGNGNGKCEQNGGNPEYVVASESYPAHSTTIYYPTCVGDRNCDECDEPLGRNLKFPGVIFLQGGSVDASAYTSIVAKIAQEGYIVAVPNAPVVTVGLQNTSPFIALGAKNLLIALNADTNSPIAGRLQPNNFALFGHSLGGVVALITGANDAAGLCRPPGGPGGPGALFFLCSGYPGFGSGLKAIITYGSSLYYSMAGAGTLFDVNTTNIPTVLIHGKNDGRVNFLNTSNTYLNSLETPKALIELDYVNHFGITDAQAFPGATTDPSPQTKSQYWSITQIATIAKTALNAHTKNDVSARNKIYVKKSFGPKFIKVVAAQL